MIVPDRILRKLWIDDDAMFRVLTATTRFGTGLELRADEVDELKETIVRLYDRIEELEDDK